VVPSVEVKQEVQEGRNPCGVGWVGRKTTENWGDKGGEVDA
jgi:hypothetical protein